jgi:hypothetical protein
MRDVLIEFLVGMPRSGNHDGEAEDEEDVYEDRAQ